MGAMDSPSVLRVRIDAQGRMVLPRRFRDEIATTPGELLVRRTAEGLLLTSTTTAGVLSTGPDGLPVLHLGRSVTNNEVLDALDRERAER
jgi:bifunctional DNA-binding transcriptional regulator/antitoxin component of YhaV-PrlF toxin-antitoxin module